ncbi:MAG: peptidylprolyl isomerase [Sideroxyarcus sp.]|nr:peptidylprolyl isomerase [Sideroxyarcus sp.]
MWNRKSSLACLFWAVALICSPFPASAADQVLATVGGEAIYSHELEMAVASSPFYTQFNTMSEDEQASLRGDMLRRIVSARLLALEAKRLGLDQTPAFKHEMDDFRLGLLYRSYMDKLRGRVTLPAATHAAMKERFKGDADALDAAQSSYRSTQFREMKLAALRQMQIDSHLQFFESRISPGIKSGTVLMQADGLRVVYGDIVDSAKWKELPNPEWVKEQLQNRSELLLVAKYAERDGANIDEQLKRYGAERLPSLMLERKTGEWIPNEETMRSWYTGHPEIGRIPASYHVGQLVVADKGEAKALRARIVKGESLFTLAGKHSIDPSGRKQNGDMGWIVEGRGMPELLKALGALQDDELSGVIVTPSGYHLIMVLERRIGRQKPFVEVRERVQQMIVNQNLPAYMGELEKRYPVSWSLMAAPTAPQPAATQ